MTDLRGAAVVIVGASSGAGRATALAMADHGARLVLNARSGDALAELVDECRRRGGDAVALAADIARPGAAECLVRATVDRYGALDVWVHTASVVVAARFGDESLEEVRRVVDTDVLGYVYAAHAVMPCFRQQRHGTLVNVASILGVVPNPLVTTYVTGKFAVVGLTRALQQDVARDRRVHVALVVPGPVDTPLFQRAANHLGRQLRAIPPAAAPERVAAAVVQGVRRPRRQIPVGFVTRLVLLAQRIAPSVTDRVVAMYSARVMTRRSVPACDTEGTLFSSPPMGQVHGGWRRGATRRRMGDAFGAVLAQRGAAFVRDHTRVDRPQRSHASR